MDVGGGLVWGGSNPAAGFQPDLHNQTDPLHRIGCSGTVVWLGSISLARLRLSSPCFPVFRHSPGNIQPFLRAHFPSSAPDRTSHDAEAPQMLFQSGDGCIQAPLFSLQASNFFPSALFPTHTP